MKTDAEYDIDPLDTRHRSQARVVTEYRQEPRLGLLVPQRMEETYTSPAPGTAPALAALGEDGIVKDAREEIRVLTVEVSTRYSAYRRFGVTTEETYRKPE
jgi:hypothetical protein